MNLDHAPRRGRAALAVAIFVLAFVAAVLSDATVATDATHLPPALVAVGRFVTAFGTSEYMFAFSALIAAVAVLALGRGHTIWHGGSLRRVAERAVYFFAAVAASGILAQIIKHVIGRARPSLLTVDGPFHFDPFSTRNALASFPSGHTTSAFAAAVALGYMRPAWRWPLIGCALLIGLSRIAVGAHFPSDVVGGAALGSSVSFGLARGFARRGLAFVSRGGRAVMKPLRSAPAGSEGET